MFNFDITTEITQQKQSNGFIYKKRSLKKEEQVLGDKNPIYFGLDEYTYNLCYFKL